MSIPLSYDGIVEALAKNPVFTFTTLEDPKKVKSKLAQAKFRAGLKGRLSFSIAPLSIEGKEAFRIEIALLPAKNPTVQAINLIQSGDI